jgi:O-antigen biosynthesis protein
VVEQDFAEMARAGFNAIRTYTLPPRWLLDIAADHGLFAMVGVAWEQHVDFLESRSRARSIEHRIRAGVAACAGHPAVLCYAVGNEIPGEIVRWLGRRPVERYVERLYEAAKSEDPGGLVTYVNYPPTEYLQLPFLDLVCFNVYLEARKDLDAYLARLHNIVGERPLLMAEIGLDSRSNGEQRQAEVLDWQIRTVFNSGCAGAFVFAWTDEWYVSYLSEMATGGAEIEDWDFGLTGRDRRPKPALEAVKDAFAETPFEPDRSWPQVSVVVCSYNGEKTLSACLERLQKLDYPELEIIVVNDGSTDSTPTIAARQGVRLITTENEGLANARNTGLRDAQGEIVAYLDDDAYPDPQWLRHLVLAFERKSSYAGVGGPNVPPPDSSLVASCVGEAPGGPIHVLISDREAEHIPGCNMAFRKDALDEVGGFDPQFRVAGDDVDICWRLLDAGFEIGFSPAALVWHEPRRSIRAYWRQQFGYGRAEALLERKWPDRYRPGAHARWAGRLYGRGLLRGFGKWRVYHGTWGSALFQSLYSPGHGKLSSFMLGPEWLLVVIALAFTSVVGFTWLPGLAALPILVAIVSIPLAMSAASAARGRSIRAVLRRRDRAARWALTTFLHLVQPLARMYGRFASSRRASRVGGRGFGMPLPMVLKFWSEDWRAGEQRLTEIESRLRQRGAIVVRGDAYDRWDLEARHGWLGAVRIRAGIEEHGGGRQLVRLRVAPRCAAAPLAVIVVLALLSVAADVDGALVAGAALGAATLLLCLLTVRSAGQAMNSVLEQLVAPESELFEGSREVARLKLEGT